MSVIPRQRVSTLVLIVALTFPATYAEPSAPPGEAEPEEAPAYAAATSKHDGGPARWGYEEGDGPAVWADLSPEYTLCGSGQEQSPIDLTGAEVSGQPTLERNYRSTSLRIIRHEHVVDVVDNGHTIQVKYDEGSTLVIGETSYDLKQYHFHAPSEHTVDGEHYPMEMHLVHQSAGGALAVIGVLIAEGAANTAFEPVWAHLPDKPGEEAHLEHVAVNVEDLLPAVHVTYRYPGSLTTPPCSEGVSWLVMIEPIELSAEQIAAFTAIISGNNRPVQTLGDRTVAVDRVEG